VDTAPQTVPWAKTRARLADAVGPVRGFQAVRVITHLHSPWSHDACDGDGLVDDVVNESCLLDLRRGLCEAGIDVAFLSDHPSYAAFQEYDQLWYPKASDVPIMKDGRQIGSTIVCDDGTVSHWFPGIEDEVMPLGLEQHVPGDAQARDDLYNRSDADAIAADTAAGALVFMAHTEQRDLAGLQEKMAAGMVGVEMFNAHAMFAPNLREQYLGLDGFGWATDIGPFTRPDATAEPDLLFLGVLANQAPSLANYDALLQEGPVVGIAGSDAHQNVLALQLRDDERVDSYRRALSWFSNHVLSTSSDPLDVKAALAAGRSYIAFEVLGAPDGFDFHLEDASGTVEMGGAGADGTLVVVCPEVAATSPHGLEASEVTATVFKNGEVFATGCGEHATDGPGGYRVEIDLTPYHLTAFLGDDPTPYLRPFPWVLSNGIRVQ